MTASNKHFGILAEFEDPTHLMRAAVELRDAGYKHFDCHSPFPIHGMDKAMGMKKTKLGWVVAAAGFSGAGGAMLLQWWTSTIAYPVVISGKPLFSMPAYVPVTFELGILFAGFAALFSIMGFNKLPRLNHPLFASEKFAKATDDGFFVSVEATDPNFDPAKTKKLLESAGAREVEVVEDE